MTSTIAAPRFRVQAPLRLALVAGLLWLLAAAAVLAERAQPAGGDDNGFYTRVLTRPGAVLVDAPGGAQVEALDPFQIYYVYGSENGFTRVGTLVEGEAVGFIDADSLIQWSSSIVTTFNRDVGSSRAQSMIFEQDAHIRDLLSNAESLPALTEQYRQAAIDGAPLPESGVISIEPAEPVNFREQFYIMPILEDQQIRLPNRRRGTLLRIASISEQDQEDIESNRAEALRNFESEIAFVIDTTMSMQPYIDSSVAAITDFADQIADSELGERVKFGLVEFRDNTTLRPALEYSTRVGIDLSDINSFKTALSDVRATTESSSGFQEDALAGLHTALTQLNWNPKAAKFIFLVTDAAPRESELSVPDLQPAQIRDLASESNVSIFTWHLRTALGGTYNDHDPAERIYEGLSAFGTSANGYYPVPGGDPAVFRSMITEHVQRWLEISEAAMQGSMVDPGAPGAAGNDALAVIGRALQLQYLGDVMGTTAPDVIDGWMLHQDIPNFNETALDIRIMLTKNQLSTLMEVTDTLIDQMTRGVMDPSSFFSNLHSAVAMLAQDPGRIGDFESLGDAVGAFLADLPYQSDIMQITEDSWNSMSGQQQFSRIQTLKSKLQALRSMYAEPAYWTDLHEGAPEGEHVALILLDLMP